MSIQKLDTIDRPEQFCQVAERVALAANIPLQRKQEWIMYHLTEMVTYVQVGGEMDLPHTLALQKIVACADLVQQQEQREDARERAIEMAQKAAEEKAIAEEWRDTWTAYCRREQIAKQREADYIRECKDLAIEANIRMNRAVSEWGNGKARAAWYRMVPSLRPGNFLDYSYQGAD